MILLWRQWCAAAAAGGAYVPRALELGEAPTDVGSIIQAINQANASALLRHSEEDGLVAPVHVTFAYQGDGWWDMIHTSCLGTEVRLSACPGRANELRILIPRADGLGMEQVADDHYRAQAARAVL